MLWGITPETWAQLWSGAIGSFVAAVIGGLVALAIVRLTNSHQSTLAREARQHAAAADMAAAFQGLQEWSYGRIGQYRPYLESARAASMRWRMDALHPGLAEELAVWPYHVYVLSDEAAQARNGATGLTPGEELLGKAVATFQEFSVKWPISNKATRNRLLSWLKKTRLEGEEQFPGRYALVRQVQ